jgi:hypothetical protein
MLRTDQNNRDDHRSEIGLKHDEIWMRTSRLGIRIRTYVKLANHSGTHQRRYFLLQMPCSAMKRL